ncbi:MAG: KOW motif-containing protein [Polyangiaceae bacterium]
MCEGDGPPDESLALRDGDFTDASPRARRDFRRRMGAWGRVVVERLRSLGHDFTVSVVDEAGDERLRFVSGTTVALALSLTGEDVRAAVELPPRQARLARTHLSDPARALQLTTVLEQLPEQFVVALAGDARSLVAPRTTIDDLRRLLDRVEREQRPLWIGWTVPRGVAVTHAALLEDQLADALVALAGVFALVTGEVSEASGVLARTKGSRRKRSPAREEDDPEPGTHHGSPGPARRRQHPREETSEREVRPDRTAGVERDGDVPAKALVDAKAPLPAYPGRQRHRAGRAVADARAAIGRGTRVRVLEGPFSGKVGVVQELDGKGGARVMLGLLAVRLDVDTLTTHVEGRRRPVLSTSHRKPVPVRS